MLLELDAEHGGGGLGVRGGERTTTASGHPFVLTGGDLPGRVGEGGAPLRRRQPRPGHGIGPQVAVVADELLGRQLVGEQVEEVAGRCGRRGCRVEAADGGPRQLGSRGPAAVGEAVRLGDVPRAVQTGAGGDERGDRGGRPGHPAGVGGEGGDERREVPREHGIAVRGERRTHTVDPDDDGSRLLSTHGA